MADITVAQNVLVPMVREVNISCFFPTGNKNDFSSFIFNIGNAAGNTRVKQDTTKHQQESQFFLHRIYSPTPQLLQTKLKPCLLSGIRQWFKGIFRLIN